MNTPRGMTSHHAHGRGMNVWLTPPALVQALGPFDLDPCFGGPRPWDTAAQHYGPDHDNGAGGLNARWFGMVWCNPPYGPHAWDWMDRCARHGRAIGLVFARTDVAGFQRTVFGKASAVLFLEGRLTFHHPTGERAPGNGGAPSALVAYGAEAAVRLARLDAPGYLVTPTPAGGRAAWDWAR